MGLAVDADGTTMNVNANSWNEAGNLLYVDQPIGTGFSNGSVHDVRDENEVAHDMAVFLKSKQWRHRDADRTENQPRAYFVHCCGRGQNAAMRIRDIQDIQQALNRPIFTNLPMQGIKDAVRLDIVKLFHQIPVKLYLYCVPPGQTCGLAAEAG